MKISNYLTSHMKMIVYLTLFLGLCELFISWNYYSLDLVARFSWVSNDFFLGSPKVIGQHGFSDFTSMVLASHDSDPWAQRYQCAYPPLVMLLLKLITFFPDNLMILWIILLAVIPLYPIMDFIRRNKELAYFLPFCIGSIPFIAMVDRGNLIGLLPLPLYFFYTQLQKNKVRNATLWLAFAIGIKFYAIIVLLFVLFQRKWRLAGYTFIITGLSNAISFLFWGNPFRLGIEFVRNVTHNSAALNTTPTVNRVDSTSSVLTILRFLHLEATVFYSWVVHHALVTSLFSFLILGLLSGLVISNYWFFCALISLQLFPNPGFSYCGCWILVAIPLMLEFEISKSRPLKVKSHELTTDRKIADIRNFAFENIFWFYALFNGTFIFITYKESNILTTTSFVFLFSFAILSLLRKLNKKINSSFGIAKGK